MDSDPISLSKLERMLTKSSWRPKGGTVWTFVCPLCRMTRRVPYRAKLGGVYQIFQLILTTLVFTWAAWPGFHLRGLVSFFPFWMVFETVYRWRRRAALICRECGFDPFLYKTDLMGAKKEIEEHWKRKFSEKGLSYPSSKAGATRLNFSLGPSSSPLSGSPPSGPNAQAPKPAAPGSPPSKSMESPLDS